MMWVYVEHGYTDAAEAWREVELACWLSGDGDVIDVRLAEAGPDGRYLPVPPEVEATIDDQDLHDAVRAKLRGS